MAEPESPPAHGGRESSVPVVASNDDHHQCFLPARICCCPRLHPLRMNQAWPCHLLWPVEDRGSDPVCHFQDQPFRGLAVSSPLECNPTLRWPCCEEAQAGHVEKEAQPAPGGSSHPAEAPDLGPSSPSWTFQPQQTARGAEDPPAEPR